MTLEEQYRLARRKSTKAPVLLELAKSGNASVRNEVAENKSTPVEALRILAVDKESYVRQRVAHHTTTPPDVLDVLSKDRIFNIRHAVASNPNCSHDTLIRLFDEYREDPIYASIIGEIASNPSTPQHILHTIITDVSDDVAGVSAKTNVALNFSARSDTLWALLEQGNRVVYQYLSGNTSAPPELIRRLLEYDEARIGLALNSSSPPDVLEALAENASSQIRGFVGGNPSTPPSVLSRLMEDGNEDVRMAAEKNPNTPKEATVALEARLNRLKSRLEALIHEEGCRPEDVVRVLGI